VQDFDDDAEGPLHDEAEDTFLEGVERSLHTPHNTPQKGFASHATAEDSPRLIEVHVGSPVASGNVEAFVDSPGEVSDRGREERSASAIAREGRQGSAG
jgi:hypothetical protein